MKFYHCNLDFIGAYVNGESKPFKPLQLDFSTAEGQQYIKAFQSLFSDVRKGDSHSPTLGYTFIVFDIDQQIGQAFFHLSDKDISE